MKGDEVMIGAGKFGVLDYTVFAGMLLISALIGIFYAWVSRKKNSTSDFLMGNRSLSVFPVSMSVVASFMSAITLLGTPAEVYQFGTMFFMINMAYFFVIPATAHLYLPVFYGLNLTSAYEYLEKRFTRSLRTMGSTVFTIHMLMYMPLVLYAPSLALAQVTGLDVLTSVLSIGIVCTFYTSIGGMKAVVWTDVFQTMMMFLSIFVIIIKGIADQGGIAQVWQTNADGQRVEFFNFDLDPTVRHTVWSLGIGGFFTWMGNYAVNQAMVQRYLTLPTLAGAQRCIWINLPTLIVLIAITCLSGMLVYDKYAMCDPISIAKVKSPDQLFPLYVMDSLSSVPGLPGLFVAGVFSGALSTVSSGVNSLAAVTLEDVVKTYLVKDLSDLWGTRLTKIIALSYGLLSIMLVWVASKLGDVLQAGLTIHGMIGGPMLGVFTLGMFVPWSNSWGAGLGLISGFVASFWIGLGTFVRKSYISKAPVSIDDCPDYYYNVTGLTQLPISNVTGPPVEMFYGYRLSYMWYSTIGFVTVMVVGVLVSLISGRQRPENLDPKLITPSFLKLYRRLRVEIGINFNEEVDKKADVDVPSSEIFSVSYPKKKNPIDDVKNGGTKKSYLNETFDTKF